MWKAVLSHWIKVININSWKGNYIVYLQKCYVLVGHSTYSCCVLSSASSSSILFVCDPTFSVVIRDQHLLFNWLGVLFLVLLDFFEELNSLFLQMKMVSHCYICSSSYIWNSAWITRRNCLSCTAFKSARRNLLKSVFWQKEKLSKTISRRCNKHLETCYSTTCCTSPVEMNPRQNLCMQSCQFPQELVERKTEQNSVHPDLMRMQTGLQMNSC